MTPTEVQLRPAAEDDLPEVAELFLAVRAASVPEMPPLRHSAVEVRAEVAGWNLAHPDEVEVWVAEDSLGIAGYAKLKEDWLDDLYVAPGRQGNGVGTALLDIVKAQRPDGFGLWVFASNGPARGFYRRKGLLELEHTDGSGNPQKAPDVRMVWPGQDPIGFLRGLIDDVDSQLGSLLERRLALTAAVQAHKPVGGPAGRDPRREQEIVERMAHLAPSFGPERLARIVHAIITESLEAADD